MNPSVSVPTDNIYKFMCLFGLAIIVVSIFSFASVYSNNLDKKIFYYEKLNNLEKIESKSKLEEDSYKMYTSLVEITNKNEKYFNKFIGIVMGFGCVLSVIGFYKWFSITQKRDDKIADLQMQKIEIELYKLKIEKQELERLNRNIEELAGPNNSG